MLFNSLTFILCFLPVTVVSYYIAARLAGPGAAKTCLILASALFYAWWNPVFVFLLAGSVLFNYATGNGILRAAGNAEVQKPALFFGIAANLLLLFYYKYFFPLLHWLDSFGFHLTSSTSSVILPLGISFFTFTQISYLVDCQAGLVKEKNFLNYTLFVIFFPHLIAGPIVHHKEMVPQFADPATYRLKAENIAVGFALFAMGLFKKAVIADHFAPLANNAFALAGVMPAPGAWGGVLSYALQLYFDFSGYSEMALGLGRLFGIRFPANFNSPYKAASIIDYWQRWHMTLTRYLTLYIYNPIALAIARRRMAAQHVLPAEAAKSFGGFISLIGFPTMVTILLAGIWHGAGWQYIIFGLLHGFYLCINHAARVWLPKRAPSGSFPRALLATGKVVLTFLCVVVAQIFFRAPSVTVAVLMLKNLAGLNQAVPLYNPRPTYDLVESVMRDLGLDLGLWYHNMQLDAPFTLLLGYLIVWGLPNVLQIMAPGAPSLSRIKAPPTGLEWHPTILWGVGMGLAALVAVLAVTGTQEFLYFQF